jgi:hypothetical protein
MPPALAGLSHPIGSSALRAAGVIHADVRRGEFRGEFNSAADPKTFKTEKGFKEKGKKRIEGMDAVMRDADACRSLLEASCRLIGTHGACPAYATSSRTSPAPPIFAAFLARRGRLSR